MGTQLLVSIPKQLLQLLPGPVPLPYFSPSSLAQPQVRGPAKGQEQKYPGSCAFLGWAQEETQLPEEGALITTEQGLKLMVRQRQAMGTIGL